MKTPMGDMAKAYLAGSMAKAAKKKKRGGKDAPRTGKKPGKKGKGC